MVDSAADHGRGELLSVAREESPVIGLVVVSHSRALAEASVDLARQMLPDGGPRLEVAAGTADGGFGTDATAIAAAIGTADDGDGVVVLMDLGSAILAAETALEFLDDRLRERVTLCPGPLVEGLVIAAVTASVGAPRHVVASEAANALLPKTTHLEPGP